MNKYACMWKVLLLLNFPFLSLHLLCGNLSSGGLHGKKPAPGDAVLTWGRGAALSLPLLRTAAGKAVREP